MSDAVNAAATRLERAVETLAAALSRPPHAAGVTPDEVAALSARLDDTLLRLRAALAEVEGDAAAGLHEDEAEPGEPVGDPAGSPESAPAAGRTAATPGGAPSGAPGGADDSSKGS